MLLLWELARPTKIDWYGWVLAEGHRLRVVPQALGITCAGEVHGNTIRWR